MIGQQSLPQLVVYGNLRGGRDHWPTAFSLTMAGGGITGGGSVLVTDNDVYDNRPGTGISLFGGAIP